MEKTTLAIDGHVHLYSVFDLKTAVESGRSNLLSNASKKSKRGNKTVPVWLLVERSDADFFEKLINNPGKYEADGFRFVKGKDDLTIEVRKDEEIVLYIFAGRQLVTAENLEVLSLISNLNIGDKEKPLDEVIQAVKDSGGIPTLNWAPGKWFFNRGKVIARQIRERENKEIFFGETTLRNTLWPKPALMRQAEQKGFRVIAGSDPLPFSGEEKRIGSFGFVLDGVFDPAKPAESVRKALAKSQPPLNLLGKRNNVFTFAVRQYKIMAEKKTRE